MKKCLISAVLLPLSLWGRISEETAVKRVYDHLLINDYLSAVAEGQKALEFYPESSSLKIATMRALCQKGDEIEALHIWEQIPKAEREERSVLEALSWGVLNKARQSSQLEIRLNVMLAAAFTNDAKALPLLLEGLRSPNAILRGLAVKLSSNYGDAPLRKEIARLLKEEKVWFVRLEVIQTVGKLQMTHLQKELQEIVSNIKTSLEEKSTALVALVNIYDKISKEELANLAHSNRAALRHLACGVAAHLELKEDIHEIFPLVNDASSEVRIAAITTLAQLKEERAVDLIRGHLEDSSFDVAITAAWAMMNFEPKTGLEKLKLWLAHPDSEYRRLAAGAIAVSGKAGMSLALKTLKESFDPYVKATLALGLISQRMHVKLAQEILYEQLKENAGTLWMWDAHYNPLFRNLAPSRMRHREGIPQFPKVVDQMVKLELLSLLCITQFPKAEEGVREFLQSQSWGVTGAAASILLGEGNEKSIEISENLLHDKDEKIRLQAALILAVMANDEKALPVLLEAYPKLDRVMKLHILEAIAQVGDSQSVPFLISQLKEPFQVLRVAAASALIQCLYH